MPDPIATNPAPAPAANEAPQQTADDALFGSMMDGAFGMSDDGDGDDLLFGDETTDSLFSGLEGEQPAEPESKPEAPSGTVTDEMMDLLVPLKINGEEVTKSLREVRDLAMQAEASAQRFEEAAAIRKRADAEIATHRKRVEEIEATQAEVAATLQDPVKLFSELLMADEARAMEFVTGLARAAQTWASKPEHERRLALREQQFIEREQAEQEARARAATAARAQAVQRGMTDAGVPAQAAPYVQPHVEAFIERYAADPRLTRAAVQEYAKRRYEKIQGDLRALLAPGAPKAPQAAPAPPKAASAKPAANPSGSPVVQPAEPKRDPSTGQFVQAPPVVERKRRVDPMDPFSYRQHTRT